MCAPRDTATAITLTRADWADVAAAYDKIDQSPEDDAPGLVKLWETLGQLGLIPPPST